MTTYTASQYAKFFLDKIGSLHGVSITIILDKGTQFTSHFLQSFQNTMGTQLRFNTMFYSQANRQSDRTI